MKPVLWLAAMNSSQTTTFWVPGSIAVIADGEFAGMEARVREVYPAEGRAVIVLRVFREGRPFQIELARLRKPRSQLRKLVRAFGFVLLTIASSPLLLLMIIPALELMQGHSLADVSLWEESILAAPMALTISGYCAILVFMGVFFERDQRF